MGAIAEAIKDYGLQYLRERADLRKVALEPVGSGAPAQVVYRRAVMAQTAGEPARARELAVRAWALLGDQHDPASDLLRPRLEAFMATLGIPPPA
jgi:hypothetical protein